MPRARGKAGTRVVSSARTCLFSCAIDCALAVRCMPPSKQQRMHTRAKIARTGAKIASRADNFRYWRANCRAAVLRAHAAAPMAARNFEGARRAAREREIRFSARTCQRQRIVSGCSDASPAHRRADLRFSAENFPLRQMRWRRWLRWRGRLRWRRGLRRIHVICRWLRIRRTRR